LHRQFRDVCQREATERELRNDLKTVWDNHSSSRRLDINVRFCSQSPTPPLMLMPPAAVDAAAICSSWPPWSTPNTYFVSLPTLPASFHLDPAMLRGLEEAPDDMIDQCAPMQRN
jgi:hypothetical protein